MSPTDSILLDRKPASPQAISLRAWLPIAHYLFQGHYDTKHHATISSDTRSAPFEGMQS